jgi:hypothetical protein
VEQRTRLIAAPRQVGETGPFIAGTDAVQRYFTVMSECDGVHAAGRREVG